MSDRKVHFSSPIHRIEYLDKQWETASRLARDGSDWLRMSLDRQRFRDRIKRTGEILDRILDFDFRQQIFKERFELIANSEQQATIATTDNNSSTTAGQTIESSSVSQQQEQLNQQSSSLPQQQWQKQQPQQQQQRQTSNNSRGRRRGKGNRKRRKNRRGHNRK